MNPYNWQSHSPRVAIARTDVGRVANLLANNGSAVILGGRGMGKSVFLGQVAAFLEQVPGVRVLLVPGPPPELTVRSCLELLAEVLDVDVRTLTSRKLFDVYFARNDAPERLVLLFDEFDRYAEKGPTSSQPPGRGFFNDLEQSRRALSRLGILATGSVGVFVFRDVLGSSFLARALHLRLRPLVRHDAETLVRPFRDRGAPLTNDVVDELFLATGGIPALLTYGLQQLWELEGRSAPERDVTEVYARFREEHGEYVKDLVGSLGDPMLSEAPRRVWESIQRESGRIKRSTLEEALGEASGSLKLGVDDVLHLLEAVGVVRLESSAVRDDPVTVYPLTGLLNLPGASKPLADLCEHFLRDLVTLLEKLHRSSVDFFRPAARGARDSGKRLVPESVFAAHLALGFDLLGWRAEREAQRGAGRTDLVLRRNGANQAAILEVKIWGRHDYKQAHRQVESYWTSEVRAAAVVQLTDAELPDWPRRYRRECLEPLDGVAVVEASADDSPVRSRFACVSTTADRVETRIDHVLLRLPRREVKPPAASPSSPR